MTGFLLVIILCMSSPPEAPAGDAGSAAQRGMHGVRVLVLDFSRDGVSPEHLDIFQSMLAAHMQSETAKVLIGREATDEVRGVTFSPAAADVIQSARASLARGKELYENLRFDEAVRELAQASKALEDHLELLESLSPAEDAHLSLALALQAAGDDDRAREELKIIVTRDATKKLDASSYPPSLISSLEVVRQEVTSSPVGSIFVETSPPLAFVYLDGKRRGTSPLSIKDVPPGVHLLTAEKTGFRRTAVKIAAGARPAAAPAQENVTIVLKSLEGEKSYGRLQALLRDGPTRDDDDDRIAEAIPGIARSCRADYVLITALRPMVDSYQSLILLYDGKDGRSIHKEGFPLSPHPKEMEESLGRVVQKILPFLQLRKEEGWEVSRELFPAREARVTWYRSWKVWAPLGGAFLIASGASFYTALEASRSYAAQADAYNKYITSPQVLDPAVAKSFKDSSEKYKTQFTLYSTWGYVTLGFSAVFIGTGVFFSISGESSNSISSLPPRVNVALVPLDGGGGLTVGLVY